MVWSLNRRRKASLLCIICMVPLLHVFLTAHFIYSAMLGKDILFENSLKMDQAQRKILNTSNQNHPRIPRIIHQIFINYIPAFKIPKTWENAMESWPRENQGYKYILWNATASGRLLQKHYPWLLNLYHSYSNIQRIDMIKLVVLFHYGGIYVDLDVQCISPLENILQNINGAQIVLTPTDPFGLANDVIMSVKGSDFMRYVILHLFDSNRWFLIPYLTVIMSTGPLYISGQYWHYPDKNEIYLLSKDCYFRECFRRFPGGSWHSIDGKVITWFLFPKTMTIYYILCFGLLVILFIICIMWLRNKRKKWSTTAPLRDNLI